ncbi:MAG: hypothetical protein MK141_14225 [Pseudoxanthomonas sp.]|uniref:hypothetical protein n=1 Tax=Pseudoxanthomonas sp. TaxID=1871049 RepID=UPI002584D053|nr:hypothetical protein [Pseudoxanthomonas sp.]MCH2092716.1 hypothetical protein [Pseudoxanthomonas sp.]
MNLVEAQAQHRRGRMLTILAESNAQGCNAPLLRTMVRGFGYKVDSDTAEIDLAWLERHGLIERRRVAGVDMVAITGRGRDVASRDLDMPGIEILED